MKLPRFLFANDVIIGARPGVDNAEKIFVDPGFVMPETAVGGLLQLRDDCLSLGEEDL